MIPKLEECFLVEESTAKGKKPNSNKVRKQFI